VQRGLDPLRHVGEILLLAFGDRRGRGGRRPPLGSAARRRNRLGLVEAA
jgi:hypothetical protein